MFAAYILPVLAANARQEATCAAPQSFTISGLTYFTPFSSNPGNASISFHAAGTLCSSTTILNPTILTVCADGNWGYLWDGKSLTVGKTYPSCTNPSTTAQVFGTITDIATFCYPIEPPYPLGYGTLCQTPAGQLSGDFTRDTLFPVSNSSSASSSPTSTGTGAASSSTTSATSTSTSSSNSSTTVGNATITITINPCSLT